MKFLRKKKQLQVSILDSEQSKKCIYSTIISSYFFFLYVFENTFSVRKMLWSSTSMDVFAEKFDLISTFG